eukprot:CAMPEP_0176364176 /NCGR_PEP_ID=MMETSP0126-20121128/19607_1 /TAXON_ID=141414 ORGANISM="Strombidinopsis acuminatum, Strain SPMC142" /NCGR_SAMPLE_ID=MMETSP0126 /ASSEMBLY_ACC=CAM_ASM_000229 /LENGTH=138 /DNA_ID=CAMNT_0017720713 /DNA_START=1483 /DNA_END=1899 /DNA_ORIENTATION=+
MTIKLNGVRQINITGASIMLGVLMNQFIIQMFVHKNNIYQSVAIQRIQLLFTVIEFIQMSIILSCAIRYPAGSFYEYLFGYELFQVFITLSQFFTIYGMVSPNPEEYDIFQVGEAEEQKEKIMDVDYQDDVNDSTLIN